MAYSAPTHRSNQRIQILVGAVAYGVVCASGTVAALSVGFFALTSFFAFIYVVSNRGPRTWGMLLLALIPVIGALIALDRLLRRAAKQVFAAFFFYIFPLFFFAAPSGARIVGGIVGGALFFAFFAYVPGIRENPWANFVFMWAVPSILFCAVAAIIVPFIGHAAHVDADHGGFGHDHGNLGHDGMHDLMTHTGYDHTMHDHSSLHSSLDVHGGLGGHSAHSDHFLDGGHIAHDHGYAADHGIASHDRFDLSSYPQQAHVQPTWFESHFDPTSGHLTIDGTHGHFNLFSQPDGGFVGHNADGAMVHFSHDPASHSITMTGPDGIVHLAQDSGTGTWMHLGPDGLTTMRTDPVTGWTHINGPGSEMTIKFNPFTNSGYGSGSG